MNIIDGLALGLLAIADLAFIVYLRRRHHRAEQTERVQRSLEFAIRRELDLESHPARRRQLRRVG